MWKVDKLWLHPDLYADEVVMKADGSDTKLFLAQLKHDRLATLLAVNEEKLRMHHEAEKINRPPRLLKRFFNWLTKV